MRTRESNDTHYENITMRPPVHNRKRTGSKNTRNSFPIVRNIDITEQVQKWPVELKEKYYSHVQGNCITAHVEGNEINSGNVEIVMKVLSTLRKNTSVKSSLDHIDDVLCLIKNVFPEYYNPPPFVFPESYNPESYKPESCKPKSYIPEGYDLEYYNPPPSSDKDLNDRYEKKLPMKDVCTLNYFICFCIMFLVLIFSLYLSLPNKEELVSNYSSKIEDWEKNILYLREKFPSQNENIWYSILSGVKTTVEEQPAQPSVFLFVHNDKKSSTCIAKAIGKEAVKLLSVSPQEPIIVRGEELKMNNSLMTDYGLFTDSYKSEIEQKRVMIVLDLQEIPAVLAQTFHILCDVENPLVHNAAFLFTMQIDGFEKQKPIAIAEKHLKLLWKELEVDIMEPLITRVTNMVLPLMFENNLSC